MTTVSEPIPSSHEPAKPPATEEPNGAALRIRYRIRFAKQGLLKWISHRDLARLWERLLRRGEFKLSMTEGFHPKPRIGFPSALALGVEGLKEVVEIELSEDLAPQEVLARMQADDQPGLKVHEVCRLPAGFGKAKLRRSDYTISLIESSTESAVQAAIDRLMSQETVTVERKKKPLQVSVADQILRLEVTDSLLHLSLAASESASLRPGDVLDLLGLGDWIERGSQIIRVGVELDEEPDVRDPSMIAIASQPTSGSANNPSSQQHPEPET